MTKAQPKIVLLLTTQYSADDIREHLARESLEAWKQMGPLRRRWFHVKRRILRTLGRWSDEQTVIKERYDFDPYRRRR